MADAILSQRPAAMMTRRRDDGITVNESTIDFDEGVIGRIADLRVCGYSSRAILNWMGSPQPVDAVRDAQETLLIAIRL